MEYLNFDSLVSDINNISCNRKYWMVRTMGGAYYGEFIRDNYIAVGYNDITLEQLNSMPENEHLSKEILKALFEDAYPNLRNTGYAVSQILRFSRDISQGDIVIIPSRSASHVAIGIVKGDMYEENILPNIDETRCQFRKRIPVSWKYRGRRAYLPPSLQLVFTSRHILSDVSSYAPYIDSVIHDYYVKDDVVNLVLRIRTRDEVSLDDFCDIKSISTLIEDFCKSYNINAGTDKIAMKVQMESPGWLRLNTKSIPKLFLFGVFGIFLTGGGIDYTEKEGFCIYTNGIMGAISDYLDREADRELVRSAVRALDTLKIKEPSDLQPFLEILQLKNEGRKMY